MFLVLSHDRDRPLRYRLAAPLGNDALQAKIGRGSKEPGTVALNMIAELDRAAGIRLNQLP
jgi:hypothetical protein